MIPLTVLEFLHAWPPFLVSTEGKTVFASKSEIRRWLERGSVLLNGVKARGHEDVGPTDSLVLHAKSNRHRITLQ